MSEAWSYIQAGKTVGPVTEEALRDLLASGQLRMDDLVWHQGIPDWTKAGQFPELRAPSAPPAAPPGPAPMPYAMSEPAPPTQEARSAVGATLAALRATKPWVRFLGVLGIIGTIVIVVIALVVLGTSQFLFRGMPAGMRMVIPVVYLLLALLQLPPVLYLNRYASRIGDLLRSEAPEDLVRALEAQKSFWKFVGIFSLIVLCFYVLIAVVVIGAALAAGGIRHWF